MKKLKKTIRYNALRIALVDAIIASSECTLENGLCTCDSCGALDRLMGITGLKNADSTGRRALRYSDSELVERSASDALEVLNIQHKHHLYQNSLSEIFDGFMELPSGAYPAYAYHQEITQEGSQNFALWYENSQLSAKRQIAFILITLALPDSYLDHFADNVNPVNEQQDSQTNWKKWCKVFEEIKMPILQLPNSITKQIKEDDLCTYPFGDVWPLETPHAPLRDGELKKLVEDILTVPDCFTWCDRSNGYLTFGGFVVRTTGMFVSQTWTFEPESNNFYINAFNEHLAPFFDTAPQSEFDEVIVVFSDFNGLAYIASTDPRSWSPKPQIFGVSTPLPNGYGLVDNWDYSTDDYQPRPLTTFDSDLFTPRLRSAARFLAECISHNQQRPPQTF